MTRVHHTPESSAPFLLRDTHGARNRGIFGVDVGLQPARRDTGHAHNPSKGDAFEQELIDQLFGVIANPALRRVGDKLTAAGLALPFGFAVMNRAVLDDLCSLTVRAVHRYDLPGDVLIPMRYSTITTPA